MSTPPVAARLPRLALLPAALLALLASAPVVAQEGDDEAFRTLDTVQVTGTRIRRAELEGQVPVHTVTRQDIERSGLTSIGDVVQQLTGS